MKNNEKSNYQCADESYMSKMHNGAKLSLPAKVVLHRITKRMGDKDHSFPSMKSIAYDEGLSLRAVKRAVSELIDNGYFARVGHRKGTTPGRPVNEYYPDLELTDNKVPIMTPYSEPLGATFEQLSATFGKDKVPIVAPVRNKGKNKEYIYMSILSEVRKVKTEFNFTNQDEEKLTEVVNRGISEADITNSILAYLEIKPKTFNLAWWEYRPASPPHSMAKTYPTTSRGKCRDCSTPDDLHSGWCQTCRPYNLEVGQFEDKIAAKNKKRKCPIHYRQLEEDGTCLMCVEGTITDNNINTFKPSEADPFAAVYSGLADDIEPADNIIPITKEPEEIEHDTAVGEEDIF